MINPHNRYAPLNGEEFYFIALDGLIMSRAFDEKDTFHIALLHYRNMFKSKEMAEYGREAVRLVLDEINVNQIPAKGLRVRVVLEANKALKLKED